MAIDQFFIVDGLNLLVRQYHSPGLNLTAPDGLPTKAIYLFTKSILDLLQIHQPAYLAVGWDGPADQCWRRRYCKQYKADRVHNDEIDIQRDYVQQILHLMKIPSITVEGYEADDVVATLATTCVSDEVHVAIVSTDKDFACLLTDPRIKLYDQFTGRWTSEVEAERKWEVKPQQMTDLLSLAGDAGDGIHGVEGWGFKTAAKNLRQFSSIKGIVQAAEEGILYGRLADNLLKAVNNGSLETYRKLVTLVKTVETRVSSDQLVAPSVIQAKKRAQPVFRNLGFKSLRV